MSTLVSVHEAKTHLSRLLKRVEAGEEVVIARNGIPVARLSAVGGPVQRQPGLLKGDVGEDVFDPLPEEELRAW